MAERTVLLDATEAVIGAHQSPPCHRLAQRRRAPARGSLTGRRSRSTPRFEVEPGTMLNLCERGEAIPKQS